MYTILVLVLTTLFIGAAADDYCQPTQYAKSMLVSGPSSDTVNVTVLELEHMYVYSAEGFVLSPSNGGPVTSRGLLIIPDENVHGGSYSPYAWDMATVGHHVVILKSITGKSDVEVYGLIVDALDADLDLHAWTLLGHGRGGQLAAKYAKIDNGAKILGVVLLAADFNVHLGDDKRGLTVVYGLDDKLVAAQTVKDAISIYGSYETHVVYYDFEHMDFAFSLCTDDDLLPSDADFTFEKFPLFSMPNSGVRVLNSNNKLNSNKLLVPPLYRVLRVSYLDEDREWIEVDDSGAFNVAAKLTHLEIVVDSRKNGYSDLKELLNNKRVELVFENILTRKTDTVYFYLSQNADINLSRGTAIKDTLTNHAYISLGLLAWRYGDQRGLHFGADYVLEVDNADPNIPVPARWYVWNNETATRGIVFYTGGALHPTGYGGLATELRNRGYTVVIPAATQRSSLHAIREGQRIVNHSNFTHLEKWTLSGHSLGGMAAGMSYVIAPSPKYDSIMMYAGRLAMDYTFRTVPVCNIFGTLDDVNPGGYMRYKDEFGPYNPAVTDFFIVEGANHYYVGDYGDQVDSIATICRDEQQRIMADISQQWLQSL